MALYYLHLNECGDVTHDLEGTERAGLAEIRVAALRGARGIMREELARGRLYLTCQIDVADAMVAIVLTVPFSDAVTITGFGVA